MQANNNEGRKAALLEWSGLIFSFSSKVNIYVNLKV
jgi:hypothetical protein